MGLFAASVVNEAQLVSALANSIVGTIELGADITTTSPTSFTVAGAFKTILVNDRILTIGGTGSNPAFTAAANQRISIDLTSGGRLVLTGSRTLLTALGAASVFITGLERDAAVAQLTQAGTGDAITGANTVAVYLRNLNASFGGALNNLGGTGAKAFLNNVALTYNGGYFNQTVSSILTNLVGVNPTTINENMGNTRVNTPAAKFQGTNLQGSLAGVNVTSLWNELSFLSIIDSAFEVTAAGTPNNLLHKIKHISNVSMKGFGGNSPSLMTDPDAAATPPVVTLDGVTLQFGEVYLQGTATYVATSFFTTGNVTVTTPVANHKIAAAGIAGTLGSTAASVGAAATFAGVTGANATVNPS